MAFTLGSFDFLILWSQIPLIVRPIYDSGEERDDEEPMEVVEPVSELHQIPINMAEKYPNPGEQDPDAYLVFVSDERFGELQKWSFMPENLQVGPTVFTWELSKRVIGPDKWLQNQEIDAMLYLFWENTSLQRWNVDRVGFMNFTFGCEIKGAYDRWRTDKKKFELSEFILAFGKGVLPSHGRTDKVWGVDVDRIYTPVCCGGNHWISLCINFLQRTIDVFDCNGMKRYREVDAFVNMVPRILKEVQTDATKKHLSVAPYSANYVPMRKGLNKKQDDCGVYALKFIECHVLGLDFSLLHDKNMKEARYKIVCDLLQAGRDEVLLQRMSKYVALEFSSCETIDLS